jgi:PAS domain S-box-containing protein
MNSDERVNILLVDDQPAKLLAYEVILKELDETLIIASSGREALECLLKNEIAVVLLDVCMPDLDGFQLAAMIRDHPRFRKIAMIFISAIQVTDFDLLRGYEMGAVDYVPVPVVPEVLRAKVKVFAELYRKTRQLEQLNAELEARVSLRTAELEASNIRLLESEQRRSLALAAGNMGSWDWDWVKNDWLWDEGHFRIFGVDPNSFRVTPENVQAMLHPDDSPKLGEALEKISQGARSYETEFRVCRPDGETRWCIGTAAATLDENGRVLRVSGVTVDITERKRAEERQMLLAREVDHRAKNALALVQAIIRLTRGGDLKTYVDTVEGRVDALARVHTLLAHSRWQGADLYRLSDEELAPYRVNGANKVTISGPPVLLQPAAAQALALALHELATNAAKYGAFSSPDGTVKLNWKYHLKGLVLSWKERGGPPVVPPTKKGFGTRSVLSSVETQLGGRAVFDWRADGLRFRLCIPQIGDFIAHDAPGRQAEVVKPAFSEQTWSPPGGRILVVEDETLIGMATCDALAELGYTTVGPIGQLVDALLIAQEQAFDAAVLDVNLNGDLVYPLADLLMRRRVPCLFLTGYAGNSIAPRFLGSPILHKPVDFALLKRFFPQRRAGSVNNQPDAFLTKGDASAVRERAPNHEDDGFMRRSRGG